jgi:hypothetical protein
VSQVSHSFLPPTPLRVWLVVLICAALFVALLSVCPQYPQTCEYPVLLLSDSSHFWVISDTPPPPPCLRSAKQMDELEHRSTNAERARVLAAHLNSSSSSSSASSAASAANGKAGSKPASASVKSGAAKAEGKGKHKGESQAPALVVLKADELLTFRVRIFNVSIHLPFFCADFLLFPTSCDCFAPHLRPVLWCVLQVVSDLLLSMRLKVETWQPSLHFLLNKLEHSHGIASDRWPLIAKAIVRCIGIHVSFLSLLCVCYSHA